MTRSIPEKTLEHWVSMYIAARFPRSAQWWPTHGEDVYVGLRMLAATPAKIFLLEIKTTEADAGMHDCRIDVAQLNAYLARPIPTFYAYPYPHWPNSVVPPTAADWGFRRSGLDWFGNWLWVDSAAGVKTRLHAMAGPQRLHRSPPMAPTPGVASRPAGSSREYRWAHFWDEVVRCGPAGTDYLRTFSPGTAEAYRLGERVEAVAPTDAEGSPFMLQQSEPLRNTSDSLVAVAVPATAVRE